MNFLGVDVGFSSIKYGLVSLGGEVKVLNFDTVVISMGSSREEKYTAALENIFQENSPYLAAGFGFPSVILEDVVLRDDVRFNDIWIKIKDIHKSQNIPTFVGNDADVSGIAEVFRADAPELCKATTIVVTLGTGIGSAIFVEGHLLPNTELGLVQIHGMRCEEYAAASIKTKESLSYEAWAARLQEALDEIELLLWPDYLILAGGISADFDEYRHLLKTRAQLRPAYYRNQSGVVGAAIYAAQRANYIKH